MKTERLVRVGNLGVLALSAVVAYAAFRFAEAISAVLLIFGVGIFLAFLLDGPIRRLDRWGLSRGMSVATIAIGLLVALGAAAFVSARPISREIHDIAERAPAYSRAIESRIVAWTGRYPYLDRQLHDADLGRQLSETGKRVASYVGRLSVGVAGALFAGLIVLVIALYTVADPKPLIRGAVMAMPRDRQRAALRIIVGTAAQIQAWVRATFWLMLIVGVMCGTGLAVIGVRGALLFGVLAGIGEAIPTIGPILTAIPPALVAFADEPVKALWVLGLFLVVQQLENHLLVPRIMAVALKLHPVSVLFCVVALGALLGPIGILVATPLCAASKVAYREMRADARRRAEAAQTSKGNE